MKKVLAVAVLMMWACGGNETSLINGISKGSLALTLQPSASVKDGVAGFKVEIFSAQLLLDSRYATLETEYLPPGFVPNAGNAHNFANALFVLVPGNYHVKTSPMKSETVPSTLCVSAEADVVVNAGATTAIALVSQCVDANNGGIEVISALNNNPQILDLTFNPSQFMSTCQSVDVTLTAQDPDGDMLSYNWEIITTPTTNIYAQNFDALNNGALGGQDGWLGSDIDFSVGADATFEGVKGVHAFGVFNTNRIIDSTTSGTFYFAYKAIANGTNGNGFQLGMDNQAGGNPILLLTKPNSPTIYYYSTAWNEAIFFTPIIDTWYIIKITYDCDTNTYGLDYMEDGGSWTATPIAGIAFMTNMTALSRIIFANDGNGAEWYVDEIVINDSSITPPTTNLSNNVFSFTAYNPGTYNVQAQACDPFNLCSLINLPIHVFGSPCQP